MWRILPITLLLTGVALAAPADDKRAAIDKVLTALKTAPSEEAAGLVEAHLVQLWLEQGSPAVSLLVSRGLRDAKAGAQDEAIEDFSDAVALDPTLPELWHRRAIARYERGDTAGAIRDLEETIRREPRHFAAFQTLSRIAENRKDWKGAYAAWEKVLDIDPKTPGGEQRLKDLKRRALGDQT